MLLPEINSWEKWGQVFTDIDLWTPVIREICRSENLPVENIKGTYPGTNAVFILDDRYVIKISPKECHDDHKNEVIIGKALMNRIPIPGIVRTGVFKDRIEWPYIIMEYKKGEAIREVRERVDKDNLIDIYARMGSIVREIHSTSLCRLPGIDISTEGWVKFISRRKSEIVEELSSAGMFSDGVIDEISEFIDDFHIEKDPHMVLLNADLTEDHLLLVEENGEWDISCLIDLADGRVGEKEYEWVALWFGLLDRSIEGLKAFMHSYDDSIIIDEAFLDKAMAFTLMHQFGRVIISMALETQGNPVVKSLRELRDILWFQV